MKEEWRDIGCCKGYEEFAGLYEVSNLGRMRSKDRVIAYKDGRKIRHKGRLLKQSLDRYGYLYVTLSINQKIKAIKVHRLVALAFIHNPNNYPVVNHKDEDKTNNMVDNLEWCTIRYNNYYGSRSSRAGRSISKAKSRPVNQYDKQGNLLHTYSSLTEAGKQFSAKTSFSNIGKCLTGINKTSYGYVWKYVKEEDK